MLVFLYDFSTHLYDLFVPRYRIGVNCGDDWSNGRG